MNTFRKLPGLPPYGDPAISFPKELGKRGQEGIVVEFTDNGKSWVGNFASGVGATGSEVVQHPDGKRVLVIADGLIWVVDPSTRIAEELATAVVGLWRASDPDGFIFNHQGIAFSRVWAGGILWRSARISWDGFKDVVVTEKEINGKAWSPSIDKWLPFVVNMKTGSFEGGTYDGPDKNEKQGFAY